MWVESSELFITNYRSFRKLYSMILTKLKKNGSYTFDYMVL